MRKIFSSVVFTFLCLVGAQASNDIWSALVLATNESPARESPRPLQSFAPAIQRIFGYNSLYLLGQKKRSLTGQSEEWLVPSNEFFFKVALLEQESSHYRVRLDLYREKNLLLTTEARLAREAPLYIRGPQWGTGQLILLLEIR